MPGGSSSSTIVDCGIHFSVGLVRPGQPIHFVFHFYHMGLELSHGPWTKKEIEQFDVSTRKTLTATCNHHPRSAVERLYLPRSAGGIGLINVENLFYWWLVAMAHHIATSSDSLVRLCYGLDNLVPTRSLCLLGPMIVVLHCQLKLICKVVILPLSRVQFVRSSMTNCCHLLPPSLCMVAFIPF